MSLFLLTFLVAAGTARADLVSSSLAGWNSVYRKSGATYTSVFAGPTIQRPNGNLDGRGRNLTWENSLDLSFKFIHNWQVKVGGGTLQYFRPADPKKPRRRETELLDPFVSLARKRLFETPYFNLETRVRYFFPWGHATKASVGRANDGGRGILNFGFYPVWSLLDGDFTIASISDLFYRFDKNAAANRESYSLKSRANFSYLLHRKLAVTAEYSTGNLRHNNAGHLNRLRDRQRVLAGLAYLPTENLLFAPTLAWGANKTFRLNRAEFGLEATYDLF